MVGLAAWQDADVVEFDPIVGREAELARLASLLTSERLVTITGPGGAGKTRLARALLRRHVTDRVTAFVDASRLSDASMLPTALARALRLRGKNADGLLDAIDRAVAGVGGLVVFDELESLPGAGASIVELLDAIPGLSVVATSRFPLDISGETTFPVAGLALPSGDRDADGRQAASVALFLARAQARGAALDADDSAVVRLVIRLDGLPLAIELAAARATVVSPAEIDRRIAAQGLEAIDPDRGDAPSLRAAIEWTLGMLGPAESRVVEAAAVCAGFDLDLLEAMLPDHDVAGAIASLVASGLVRPVGAGDEPRRFDLLETIRAAALMRAGPTVPREMRVAHARTVLARAQALDRRSVTEPAPVIEAFEVDAVNVRRALAWLTETSPQDGYRLYTAAVRMWRCGFRSREAVDAYLALAARSDEPTFARSRALTLYSTIVWETDGTEVARRATVESIELARQVSDHQSVVHGLAGLIWMETADPDRAGVARLARDLDRAAELGDDTDASFHASLADARWALAALIHGTSSDASLAAAHDAARLAHGVSPVREMTALGNIAYAQVLRGSFADAVAPADRSVQIARDLRHDTIAGFLATLAEAETGAGRLDRAHSSLAEAIDSVVADRPWDVDFVAVLRAATGFLAGSGRGEDAARVAGAFGAIADAHPELPLVDDRTLVERSLVSARRRAGHLKVESALRAGAREDPVAVLRSVRQDLATDHEMREPKSPVALRHGVLTRREVEVLTLLGQGRSDREIAAALSISAKTASVHVANIKSKLGSDSRLAVALQARELGLA